MGDSVADSFVDRYEAFAGDMLSRFVETEVPRRLASLSGSEAEWIRSGADPFPRSLIGRVRDCDASFDDRVYTITVIAGTWLNACTGTTWSVGPVHPIRSSEFSEHIGIGLAAPNRRSFTPLLGQVENVIRDRDEGLDFLQSMAEFDKWSAAGGH